ncbi:MAG: dynamin family protein [Prevotella sp.]|nr:dynamin family protein [Prevotella sp.]
MAYSKEKQQQLMTSLINIGSLAGTNTTGTADGVEGLGMGLEQNKCNEEAKAVRDGLFKVAIIGTFASGKSTVINALVGSKILPESALPSTAILTYIQYGTDEDHVDVYMADEILEDGSVRTGECRYMNVADFQEEYRYTLADQRQFEETGIIDRFAIVKYAVMYCSKPLMEGGVSIIDSPGLEDKKVATELALKIAQEAQAIIYVVTQKGFANPDKQYITSTFHNCPNNVFFLLNKFDLVRIEEREEAKGKLKLDLKPIFTNEKGVFDEELYNRRVFGISALRALDARRGMTYDYETEEERPLSADECKRKYELSNFAPFEAELEEFLTTDKKCVVQYDNCFSRMASTYRNAKAQIDDYIRAYESQIQMDENQKAEYAKIIDDIRQHITLTEKTVDNCSLRIQNKIADVLNGCANTIGNSWEQDMVVLAGKIDVGTLSYMWTGIKQMNPLASKESKKADIEKFTGKFITAVSDYFVEKVEEYLNENMEVIYKEVESCQKQLNTSLDGIETLFEGLSGKITQGGGTPIAESDKNWLQIIISAYLGDISKMINGATGGKTSWVEFLKKTIFNTVWQFVLLSLVDGGLGFLLALAIEYLQGRSDKNDNVKKILSKSKNDIVKTIRQQTSEIRNSLNEKIAVGINEKKVEICEDMRLKLRDEQNKMETINATLSNHNFNLNAEKERFDTILSAIYGEANKAYVVVYGKEITLHQFENL